MATPESIFKELEGRFTYEAPITELILSKGITTLAEFSHYCTDTADVVATFITPIATKLTNERLQGARLKMAWTAIVAGEKAKESAQVEGVALDEEELLPATSLANIKATFFKRYHWMPPPEQQPSDKLLSKLSRAFTKRSLEVMSAHTVKTLFNQRSGTSKRMKVAPNLWIGSVGDDETAVPVEDWSSYADNLFVYLLGLAMVGATPISPTPTTAESLATDTVDYVQFPWDLAWRYHARAVQCAKRYPEHNRLAVVSSLDLQHRAEWAQKFANTDDSLGKDEWKPYVGEDGATIYPSKEEAEYSAALVFTLAVSASHWAAAQGYAVMRIPRLPAIECAGDRRGWIQWDPRTFREFAMQPTALSLGLKPEGPEFSDMPIRVHIHDVLLPDKTLPADVVYIGHGHFTHRLSPSKWENPFRVGTHGTHVDTILQFINHWEASPLAQEVPELAGKRLACDCNSTDPCHGDVIAAHYMMTTHRNRSSRRRRSTSSRLVMLAGLRVVRSVPVAFSQGAAMSLIKNQFPQVNFHGVRWPVLEDLINQPVFVNFRDWVHDQGFAADGPLGPTVLPSLGVAAFRAGTAEQAGAAGKRLALPPVVPFNLEPEQHFFAAMNVQSQGCPLDYPAPVDRDLAYASSVMVLYHQQLADYRAASLEVFRALAVPYLLPLGASKVMSPEDMEVIHNAGQVDQQNQWCTSEFGWDELQAHNRPFRLIKRFVITQASGKKRVIDDAASGGQSLLSQDGNKLQFCSALQPCAHVQTLAATTLHHFGAEAKLHEQVSAEKISQMPTVRSRWILLHPGRVLRCFAILCSFYYDDATIQDWESTAARSQDLVAQIMSLLGYPFAEAKRQGPSVSGDFLGLVHDFSAILTAQRIQVWIRERLQPKIQDFIHTAIDSNQLHPGTAAKLYGCVTFLDQAVFGKIARAGLNALKDRQSKEKQEERVLKGLHKRQEAQRARAEARFPELLGQGSSTEGQARTVVLEGDSVERPRKRVRRTEKRHRGVVLRERVAGSPAPVPAGSTAVAAGSTAPQEKRKRRRKRRTLQGVPRIQLRSVARPRQNLNLAGLKLSSVKRQWGRQSFRERVAAKQQIRRLLPRGLVGESLLTLPAEACSSCDERTRKNRPAQRTATTDPQTNILQNLERANQSILELGNMVQQQQMQLAQLQQQANVAHHQHGVSVNTVDVDETRPAAHSQPGLIDTRTLGKPETFKGDANEFADWQFIFKSYMSCVNPLFAELLERVEASKVPVPNRFLKENERAMSSQLYFVLVMLLRNRALDIAYNAGVAEGLEAYRRLHQLYHPRVASRYVGSLSAILATKFGSDIEAELESFDKVVRRYEMESGKTIDDEMLLGIVIHGLQDQATRDHLIMNASRLTTYNTVRTELLEMARTNRVLQQMPVPMDISAAPYKGKGKGKKGDTKGKDPKGKGKSEDKGGKGKSSKGKTQKTENPHKDKECRYCHKMGHIKSECRKRIGSGKNRPHSGVPHAEEEPEPMGASPELIAGCVGLEKDILIDSGAGSHLFEKGFDDSAINVGSSRVGMVTLTGEPLSTGSLKRSIITTDAGNFSIDYAESDKVQFSVLSAGKAAERGTWTVIGPGQQCMILGRNANKIKKALVETEKIRLVKKRGVYWLPAKPCQSAGSPAKGAGSTAPLAAVRPAAKTVPAEA
eukprot:symbB.v1.2.037046.t1/scaffold5326.1/size28399/1